MARCDARGRDWLLSDISDLSVGCCRAAPQQAVAVLPRSSLLAAALFVAIAAVVFVIAFEG